jgi:hypothetical protein
MKYICLGYYEKEKHDAMTEDEKNAMWDTCFEYDDDLRAKGHWAGGPRDASRCPNSDMGGRKRASSMTQTVVSDLQCGYFDWHAWC